MSGILSKSRTKTEKDKNCAEEEEGEGCEEVQG
jgi:hypothetical protein